MRTWSDLTSRQQTVVLIAASVQLSLATTAWIDLANRPAHLVNGSKGLWGLTIGLNFVGPVLYFTVGVRRPH
ncbi:hypothetical protein [Microbacterium sp. A93]|uniref:hypothetical protein n=1 Tax=Microbacterium sp. A93 TaxID=3450716 RepID=UPI003F437696